MGSIKLAFSVYLSLGLTIFGFAQAEPSKEWKSFQPEGEIFTVEMPAKVLNKSSLDKAHKRFYSAVNGTFFAIFSEKLGKESDCSKAMEFVHSFEQSGSRSMIGSLVAEHFIFEDGDGFKHDVLSFVTDKRTYVFHAISPTEKNPSVSRFFGSLKINDVQASEADAPGSIKPNPLDPTATDSTKGNKLGQDGEYGSGNGAGSRSGTNPPVAVAAVSTPLKVNSAPKAAYSDLARLYWIEGTVILKVTLLANGQVGSIVPVTRLPFGMTQLAIQAARLIKFEPKKINDIPVSVTKTIEYSFNFY